MFSLAGEPGDGLALTQEAKFNLYVICLELCTNVLRHAHLRLVRQGDWLAVQLNDDGIGMAHSSEGGMGLRNIRERARTMGAQFRLERGEGRGTRASLFLPLSASSIPG